MKQTSKKGSLYAVGTAGILFSALMHFFWLPYPKGIIISLGNTGFVSDAVTSAIYYTFITVYLVSVFRILSRTIDYDAKHTVMKYVFSLITVLAAVLLLDALQLFFNSFSGYYAVIVSDLRIVLEWLIVFSVILRVLRLKRSPKSKKPIISACVLLIVSLAIAAALDLADIAAIRRTAEKYTLSGAETLTVIQNTDFMHGARGAALDTVSGIIIFTAAFFSRAAKDESENKEKVSLYMVILRISLIFVMCFMLCGVKTVLLPQSALHNTNIGRSSSSHSIADFYADTSVMRISRGEGDDCSKEVYCMTKCEIRYADKLLYKCRIDGEFCGMNIEIQGNRIIMSDGFERVDIGGIEVKVLPDRAICYAIGETPYCIPLRGIKNQSENRVVTDFCKKMLEDGRLEYYEYSCEYLSKYAPDILKPYTERYAAKNFTEQELISCGGISTDYIAKLAESFS
jgi:hypothetical protein